MRQLIRFEIGKMLRRPLVLASFIGLIFFMAIMEYNWVVPGYGAVVSAANGQRVTLENFKAIQASKEISDIYSGSFTDEKVRAIIEAYDMPDSFWEANGLDPNRERYYSHNLMYDTLSVNGFIDYDGGYSGLTVKDVFGTLAPDLIIGYSTGWECTVYTLLYTFLTWGCIVVIIVAPVFSEEYTSHMDALILTGIHGRKKCTVAKTIASFIIAITGSLLCVAVSTLLLLTVHGSMGWDSSVQLGELQIFERIPYRMNWLQAYGLACLAWFGGILVLTSIVLVVSALAKNSFSALVIAFSIYVVPMFLPWNLLPESVEFWGHLFPINQMQLMNLLSFHKLSLGSLEFAPVYLAVPITVIALVTGILWSKKEFSHHQVV